MARFAGALRPHLLHPACSSPIRRGILATATLRAAPGRDPAAIGAALEDAYGGEPFVTRPPAPTGCW